jgi:hypothetical protein
VHVFLDLCQVPRAANTDLVISGEIQFDQGPGVFLDFGKECTAAFPDLVKSGEDQFGQGPDAVLDFGQERTAANPDGLGSGNDFVEKHCHLTLELYNPGVNLVGDELEFVIAVLKNRIAELEFVRLRVKVFNNNDSRWDGKSRLERKNLIFFIV